MEVFRLIMLRSVDGLFGGETALWRDFKRASERKTRENFKRRKRDEREREIGIERKRGREEENRRDEERERERGRTEPKSIFKAALVPVKI